MTALAYSDRTAFRMLLAELLRPVLKQAPDECRFPVKKLFMSFDYLDRPTYGPSPRILSPSISGVLPEEASRFYPLVKLLFLESRGRGRDSLKRSRASGPRVDTPRPIYFS